MDDTAAHLMRLRDAQSTDEALAIKLHAYCRENRHSHIQRTVTEPTLRLIGRDPRKLWYPTARYLLPPIHQLMDPECGGSEDPNDVLRIVRCAAKAWRAIAEEYLILMVPRLAPDGTIAAERALAEAMQFMDRLPSSPVSAVRRT